ncbi:hypothetical protein PR048_024703 [Dryococelus australis]|uniref:Uncharacterized protein n=1 Tax=Dryococelus australis TaxID=614101 RepID=A0ABQ9GPA0_9NEOP|nr:hypothetical protein PR048_024703 [Dryococelus australis]
MRCTAQLIVNSLYLGVRGLGVRTWLNVVWAREYTARNITVTSGAWSSLTGLITQLAAKCSVRRRKKGSGTRCSRRLYAWLDRLWFKTSLLEETCDRHLRELGRCIERQRQPSVYQRQTISVREPCEFSRVKSLDNISKSTDATRPLQLYNRVQCSIGRRFTSTLSCGTVLNNSRCRVDTSVWAAEVAWVHVDRCTLACVDFPYSRCPPSLLSICTVARFPPILGCTLSLASSRTSPPEGELTQVGGGKWKTSEKTGRPVASYSTIPTCENPGFKPVSPCWEALALDRRMNKVTRPTAMLIFHKAEEYTVCIQVDLKGTMQLHVQGQEARERYGRQLYARLAPHRSYAQGVQCFHRDAVLEVSMERRRNARVGETGDPRENPPTSSVVWLDSLMRKSGSEHLPSFFHFSTGNRTQFA